MVWIFLTAQACISAAGLLTLRYFMPKFLETVWSSPPGIWIGILVGGSLYAASFLAWLIILGTYKVSFAYPYTIGVTLAITVIGAALIFKEHISPIQIIGLFLLASSVFLVSTNGTK